jgi:hypothetical protein
MLVWCAAPAAAEPGVPQAQLRQGRRVREALKDCIHEAGVAQVHQPRPLWQVQHSVDSTPREVGTCTALEGIRTGRDAASQPGTKEQVVQG